MALKYGEVLDERLCNHLKKAAAGSMKRILKDAHKKYGISVSTFQSLLNREIKFKEKYTEPLNFIMYETNNINEDKIYHITKHIKELQDFKLINKEKED